MKKNKFPGSGSGIDESGSETLHILRTGITPLHILLSVSTLPKGEGEGVGRCLPELKPPEGRTSDNKRAENTCDFQPDSACKKSLHVLRRRKYEEKKLF
jgi:hypothetical protein